MKDHCKEFLSRNRSRFPILCSFWKIHFEVDSERSVQIGISELHQTTGFVHRPPTKLISTVIDYGRLAPQNQNA